MQQPKKKKKKKKAKQSKLEASSPQLSAKLPVVIFHSVTPAAQMSILVPGHRSSALASSGAWNAGEPEELAHRSLCENLRETNKKNN